MAFWDDVVKYSLALSAQLIPKFFIVELATPEFGLFRLDIPVQAVEDLLLIEEQSVLFAGSELSDFSLQPRHARGGNEL